jgi:hypothetical protein
VTADVTLPFLKFHAKNPHVYELFKRFANEAIAAGRKRFSSKIICERIRWHTLIETSDEIWKINNNYTADYARLFMQDFPQYEGYFATRGRRCLCGTDDEADEAA